MGGAALTEADEKVRAAVAALDEWERLVVLRHSLRHDLQEADGEVVALHAELMKEEHDVRRYEQGVWAFVYSLLADGQTRLTKEQREAAEAAARHQEAAAKRDRLSEEVASLSARIAERRGTKAALGAARAEKEALLVAGGGPSARELSQLSETLGKLDGEARALDEAMEVGRRVQKWLAELAVLLKSALEWSINGSVSFEMMSHSVKRQKLDDALGLAGTIAAELTMFHRELHDVGVSLSTAVGAAADRGKFSDVWLDNLFGDLGTTDRIADAKAAAASTIASVEARLGEMQARAAEVQACLGELTERRVQLIEA